MYIHKLFAENLRSECMRHDSIAAVCDGIGINRQQFNRYLAGNSLPNSGTLRKICAFLNVSEQSLFFRPEEGLQQSLVPRWQSEYVRGPWHLLGKQLKGFDTRVEHMPNGFYYCYFPLQNIPGMLIRSLVMLQENSRGKIFIRLTALSSDASSKRPASAARHKGIVVANPNEIYFLGVNRYRPGQLSLMTIERANNANQQIYTGMTLTRSVSKLHAAQTCLIQVSGLPLKEMIKKIGFVHLADVSVNPLVASAFS